MEYLPKNIEDNFVELQDNPALSPMQIIAKFNIPPDEVRTMMKNGTFLPEQERNSPLEDGDILTVWPAIQGG